MKRIEAVIFDWAGTTVDYGSMAPVHAMKDAFLSHQINVSLDEIRKPMGMLKMDHIKAVLEMEHIRFGFTQMHGREYENKDIEKIYSHFEKNILAVLHQHTTVMDGVLKTQDYLRNANIKIGSTTGYTRQMIDIVARSAAEQGYKPDCIVSADQVSHGRPYPYMIYQNMQALKVREINNVIKVGDTIVDIQEGLYAGCWSVGVIKGSSLLGLDKDEASSLSERELHMKMQLAKYEMLAAGADFVIETMDELPWVIQLVQQRLNQTVMTGS